MNHASLVIFAAKVRALIDGHHITNAGSAEFDYIGSLIKDLDGIETGGLVQSGAGIVRERYDPITPLAQRCKSSNEF